MASLGRCLAAILGLHEPHPRVCIGFVISRQTLVQSRHMATRSMCNRSRALLTWAIYCPKNTWVTKMRSLRIISPKIRKLRVNDHDLKLRRGRGEGDLVVATPPDNPDRSRRRCTRMARHRCPDLPQPDAPVGGPRRQRLSASPPRRAAQQQP